MNIQLNPQLAKAGSGGSGRIDSTGKYKGEIKHCKTWLTGQNAKMISIKFASDSGQETNIKICIFNRDGSETFGYTLLQAIMACCKLRGLTEQNVTIDDYNHETKQTEPMPRTIYKELTGVKIGFALYRHDQDKYSNPNEPTFTMEIAAPFEYESEQTASEVLEQKPAKQLEKIVINLSDKDTRNQSRGGGQASQNAQGSYQPPSQTGAVGAGLSDFDDDIPFNKLQNVLAI